MAITQIADLGAASVKTAGSTISVTCASAVPAGSVVVLWAAWDAVGGGYGQITDSQGNIYTRFGWFAHGSVGAGMMAVAYVETALTTSDTITHTNPTGSDIAKAISAQAFSIREGHRPLVHREITATQTLGADPVSRTVSSLNNQEWLFCHLLAAQAPSTDTYTWDADYTQITSAGTTGGTADSNMTVLGGYRIATLTTDTVDVSSDTADRDYIQVLTVISEVPAEAPFPLTPLLDDFARADENPLDGGIWDTGSCIPAVSRKLQLVSGKAALAPGVATRGGQWTLAPAVTNTSEVHATISTAPATNGHEVGLFLGGGCGNSANQTGLKVAWVFDASELDYISCDLSGNTGGTTDGRRVFLDIADGVKFGMRTRGNYTHIFADTGAGWRWCIAIDRSFVTAVPKFGLGITGTVARVDDFGCGSLRKAQIYRRLG